jgi:hypothetical protein
MHPHDYLILLHHMFQGTRECGCEYLAMLQRFVLDNFASQLERQRDNVLFCLLQHCGP